MKETNCLECKHGTWNEWFWEWECNEEKRGTSRIYDKIGNRHVYENNCPLFELDKNKTKEMTFMHVRGGKKEVFARIRRDD